MHMNKIVTFTKTVWEAFSLLTTISAIRYLPYKNYINFGLDWKLKCTRNSVLVNLWEGLRPLLENVTFIYVNSIFEAIPLKISGSTASNKWFVEFSSVKIIFVIFKCHSSLSCFILHHVCTCWADLVRLLYSLTVFSLFQTFSDVKKMAVTTVIFAAYLNNKTYNHL